MSKNAEKQFPSFVLIPVEGSKVLININQVRAIDDIGKGRCRLLFSDNFRITITGSGADELVAQLSAHSITVDSSSTMKIWETLGEQP